MGCDVMLEKDNKPFVVNTSLSILGYWLGSFIFLVIPTTGFVCFVSLLMALNDRTWGWLWLPVAAFLGMILVSLLAYRNMLGAVVDSAGMTLTKPWQPSYRRHMAWSDIQALEVKFDTRIHRRRQTGSIELTIQDGSIKRVVSCPHDIELFRMIVSHAGLDLRKGPENWQAKADDPFEMLRRYKFSKQHWLWARGDIGA